MKKEIIKEQFIKVHKRWGQIEFLGALKNTAPKWTFAKYLKGVDLTFDQEREIVQVPEDRRIHKILWMRTVNVGYMGNSFLLCSWHTQLHIY